MTPRRVSRFAALWPLVVTLALPLALALALAPALPAHAAAAKIGFRPLTLAQALEAARAESKLVFVDVFATWCSPCKEMDEKVFTRPEAVEAATAGYVAVRFDGEKGEGLDLYKRYHVTGFPTMLILDGNGVEIDRIFGSLETEKFVEALRDYRAGKGTLAALEDTLARAGTGADIDLMFEVGFRHALRGDGAAAEKLLGHVVKLDHENKRGYASKALFALAAYLYNPGEDWSCAAKNFSRLLDRYPGAPEAADALKPLAKAYLKIGRLKDVRATLERLLVPAAGAPSTGTGAPDSGADAAAAAKPTPRPGKSYNVYSWFCFQYKFDLPRGVEVAKKGLELDPGYAGLWDTLAELYGAMGRSADAIVATDKAIALEPGDSYFKEQRAKFVAMAKARGAGPKKPEAK